MNYSRRQFICQTLASIPLAGLGPGKLLAQQRQGNAEEAFPTWKFPDLSVSLRHPVMIRSVELLKTQGELMLVATSSDGVKGITQCNDRMQNLVSLLKGLVIPHFLNKDARQIATLVDNAYRLNSNYKYAGMPLWNCIGSVEIALWDLLGKAASIPVYRLLGTRLRNEYPVYISDFNRGGDPQKIADALLAKVQATGATGVKIKVGGRMSNTREDTIQTKRFVPVVRKTLGDDAVIYADANGSYTAKEGVETGRMLEELGVEIFEEPCNFEDEDGTRKVNESLTKVKLAGGEQDTSLYKFRRLSESNVYDILQPDLYYNGGILRTLHVSVIAKEFGNRNIAPHTPKADPLIAPFWQVAALVPNLYGLQEYVYNPGESTPSWHTKINASGGKVRIPDEPGLGISYDDGIWKSAEKVI